MKRSRDSKSSDSLKQPSLSSFFSPKKNADLAEKKSNEKVPINLDEDEAVIPIPKSSKKKIGDVKENGVWNYDCENWRKFCCLLLILIFIWFLREF